jgi:hypothetical protein
MRAGSRNGVLAERPGNVTGAAAWKAMGYLPQDDWARWVKPVS